jgi:spore maturation protein CgeB
MLLRRLKRLNVKLVCYNPDHPFIYSGRGSGNRWMTKSIKLYDLYLTYDIHAASCLKKIGVSTSIIPFGYESDCIKEEFVSEESESIRVCFVGNPDVNRAAFIEEFAKSIRIDLYGHFWEDFVSANSNIRVFDGVYGQDHWRILSKYRIHLNLLRPHNLNSHNMRTFSVPAAGGIMLAPFTDDHNKFFLDKRDVFLFDDVKDATRLAKEILGFGYVEAQEIRRNARERSLRSDYSYERRAKDMLSLCLSFFEH